MKNCIKTTIAACAAVAAVFPLLAHADTLVESFKGAFGGMTGKNGNLTMEVHTSASLPPDGAGPTSYFFGSNYVGTKCWVGYGVATSVEFKAMGTLPNQVTVSGTIPVTWVNYCGAPSSFTETITFNGTLNAITDQGNRDFDVLHQEFGGVVRFNIIDDQTWAPATPNGSISSPAFGTVIPNIATVGQSASHNVVITW